MANDIKFSYLCDILEDIKKNPNQEYKRKTLQRFYDELRVKTEGSSESSLYPVIRLLIPQLERNRSYGMKEEGLRRAILKILCISNNSNDSKTLQNCHDFPSTAYNILKKFYLNSKELTVKAINDALDVVSNGENINEKVQALTNLFNKTSAYEQKWILCILLKHLGLGLGHKKILNLFHPDAESLFDNTNDLKHVCLSLHDKTVHASEIEINLFASFCPMLSKRCDAKELLKNISDDKAYIVENKFDGERFQLHMRDGTFMFFSRRGFDFTRKFGNSFTTGIYTPLLKGVFDDTVKSVIVDGEMMGYDTVRKRMGTKGMNFDVKNLSDNSIHQPCLCIFDIVYLNGKTLAKMPLRERKEIIKQVIKPKEGVIVLSEVKEVVGKKRIIDELNESLIKKEEGIVFKDPNSLYVTNSRKDGWWKMKLEYFSGVMTDLDVLIMGGFYGKNNKVDRLLVGVAVPSERGERPAIFHSLAILSTGLTRNEWATINENLKDHWTKTSGNNFEDSGLRFGKTKPDVWILPERSYILEVRASELTKLPRNNPEYKASYTLRFPRIQQLRTDKPYYDCLTTDELGELTEGNQPVEKLFKRPLEMVDIELEMQKTKKFRTRFTVNIPDVEEIKSDILKGKEFCVWSGDETRSIADVEKAIKENGGAINKIESSKTYCVLMGRHQQRIDYYKGDVDVVKLSWILNVIELQNFYEYEPCDVVYASSKTKLKFMETFDKYGDPYAEELLQTDYDKIAGLMRNNEFVIRPLPREIDELHDELNVEMKFQLFSDYVAYFDKYEEINNETSSIIYSSKLDELEFQFWGGKVSSVLNDAVNLVIVNDNDRIPKIKEIYNKKIELNTSLVDVINDYLEKHNF